uniref:Uncharacterized protein n=1 Tax=Anguilla anguilla TaxID=7936 RepID=A0A0E9XL76_ANGAN
MRHMHSHHTCGTICQAFNSRPVNWFYN